MAEVFAQDETSFLVVVAGDSDKPLAVVVELEIESVSFPPFNIYSILNRGDWADVTDKEGAEKAMELVRQDKRL